MDGAQQPHRELRQVLAHLSPPGSEPVGLASVPPLLPADRHGVGGGTVVRVATWRVTLRARR